MAEDTRTGKELVDALIRWEASGGVWRVLARGPSGVSVALLRCDAGEEVDRIASDRTDWLAYLTDREGSDGTGENRH